MTNKKTNHKQEEKKSPVLNEKTKEKLHEMSSEAKEKFGEASDVVKKEAKELGERWKKAWWSISAWWEYSSNVERISMILGIIFLAIALWQLRAILLGVVLLVLGILGVTGFFVNKE